MYFSAVMILPYINRISKKKKRGVFSGIIDAPPVPVDVA